MTPGTGRRCGAPPRRWVRWAPHATTDRSGPSRFPPGRVHWHNSIHHHRRGSDPCASAPSSASRPLHCSPSPPVAATTTTPAQRPRPRHRPPPTDRHDGHHRGRLHQRRLDVSRAGGDAVAAGQPFPAARCEENKAAGKIRYLSGFDFAATASIIDVVMAERAGLLRRPLPRRRAAARVLDVQLPDHRRRPGRDRVGRLVQRGRRLRHRQRRRARRHRRRGAHRHRQPDHEAGRGGDARRRQGQDDRREGQDPGQRGRDARRRRARRGHRLPDRAARRLRPDRPLPPRGHRRVPRLQEQRAGPARSGRADVRPVRPDEVRRPRLVRDPLRHQGVGRRPPDGDGGLPAGDDEGPRRRPRRSRTRPPRRRSTSSRPTATRATCRWRARRTGGTPTPRRCRPRPRPAPASASPTSPPCSRSSTPTPRSACSAAPRPTRRRSSTPPPSSRSTTAPRSSGPAADPIRVLRVIGVSEVGTLHRPHSDAPQTLGWGSAQVGGGAGIIVGVIEHLRAAWDELTAPGAPFAMSTIDVRGVPTRVFDSAPPTMRAIWDVHAFFGDRTYVVYEDEHHTYAEIGAQVRSLAHHLRDVHGVGHGDRVALAMRNYPEWVVGYWAITSIGAAVVGLNAWWTTPELEYGLHDSRPEGADRRRRAHRAGPAGARRPARRAAAGADRRAHRSGAARPTRPLGRRRVGRRCPGRAARRPTSTPTTTPRSSTRRARPGTRRAPSSPTAARSTTSSTSCSGRSSPVPPRPRRSPPAR